MLVLGLEQLAQAGADDGVVVDDQDADRSSAGTIAAPRRRSSCRRPGCDSSCSGRRAARAARASRAGRAPRVPASGAKPRPSSSITAVDRARAAREHDADRARLRVLDDVRQRLLHDPVERRLDLGREPLVAELRLEARTRIPVCSANVSRRRSSAATRPKSSSAFGRSSTASRRTSWSVATTSSRTSASAAPLLVASSPPRPPSARAGSTSAPGRSRRAARARAGGARAPAPRRPGAARRARRAAERSTATAARGAKVSASRRSASVKRGSLPELVVGGQHADRTAARRRAARRARSRAEPPRRLLVDLGVVDQRVDALAAAAARARGRSSSAARSQLQPDELVRTLAVGRLDPERPVVGRQGDRDEARVDQLAQPARRSARAAAASSISLASAFPTSFSDSSWRDHAVADS